MLKMSSFYFIVLYMKANQKLLIEITSNSSKANMRKWKTSYYENILKWNKNS